MPRMRKVNSNGPPPGCPNDDSAADREIDAATAAAMRADVVHVRAAQSSHEMRDVLELERARAVWNAGLQHDYTKAPWLRQGGGEKP